MFDHAVSVTFRDSIYTPWTLSTNVNEKFGSRFSLTVSDGSAATFNSYASTFGELRDAVANREACVFVGFPGPNGDFVCGHLAFNLLPARKQPSIRSITIDDMVSLIDRLETKYAKVLEAATPKLPTIEPDTWYRLYMPYCAYRDGVWYVGSPAIGYATLDAKPVKSFGPTGPEGSPTGNLFGDILVNSGAFASRIVRVHEKTGAEYLAKNFPNAPAL